MESHVKGTFELLPRISLDQSPSPLHEISEHFVHPHASSSNSPNRTNCVKIEARKQNLLQSDAMRFPEKPGCYGFRLRQDLLRFASPWFFDAIDSTVTAGYHLAAFVLSYKIGSAAIYSELWDLFRTLVIILGGNLTGGTIPLYDG